MVYLAKYYVVDPRSGDEIMGEYSAPWCSTYYINADNSDKALEIARLHRRELKESYTYSISLESLVEVL